MKTLTASILTALAAQAAAQDATNDQEADYELVTTAIHTIRSETALPVTVLAGDELRNATRATIGDTLANQPGISNASFGPAVGQTVIRGQQGRRVMNLTNAMGNADASGNSADHANTVEPILADAIEVLRGPATLLYGGGAIGGVVNVIDSRIPRSILNKPEFSFESRHDTAADQDSVVGKLEFSTGNVTWHLDGLHREWNNQDIPGLAIAPEYLEDDEHHDDHEGEEHEDEEEHHEDEEIENTDGFIGNTAGETEAYTLGASYVFDNGFFGIAVNHIDNYYGLPPGVHGHHEEEEHHDEEEHEDEEEHHEEEEEHGDENVFINMERTRYDVAGEWREVSPLVEHVDYRLTYTDYEHQEIEGVGEIGTQFSNDSLQQRLQITHAEINGWHGVLGIQTSDEEFGAVGIESFIPVTDISSRGLFLVEDLHMENVTIELGARYNVDDYDPKNSIAPGRDFNTYSFSASGLWDINMNTTLGLTWSHSQRAPSIEELYSNYGIANPEECVIHFATAACEIGNVNFSEEKSNNIDITYNLEQGNLSLAVTAFYNQFDDYIGQIATGDEVDEFPVREYQQLDARFTGVELDATWMLTDYLSLQIFADAINGSFDNNGDAPRIPPRRIGSRLDYNGGNWSAFLSVLDAAKQDQPGFFELETDGYTRWDIGANYTMAINDNSELTLFAKGRNLTDEEIRLSTSFLRGFAPEAGRSVEVGFRFTY